MSDEIVLSADAKAEIEALGKRYEEAIIDALFDTEAERESAKARLAALNAVHKSDDDVSGDLAVGDDDETLWDDGEGETYMASESHEEDDFEVTAEIAKTSDDELRVVWGWASVATVGGRPVIDHEGDIIPVAELQKAAHEFMAKSRIGGVDHSYEGDDPVQIGEVVDSVVLTRDVQKALGVDLGREGWWVGVKIHDDAIWQGIKDGQYAAFSIGGSGVRQEVR